LTVLSPSDKTGADKTRAELETLEIALLNCNDSGIQKVIRDWIVKAKQQLASERKSRPGD